DSRHEDRDYSYPDDGTRAHGPCRPQAAKKRSSSKAKNAAHRTHIPR
ncbi:MAG: hypothetical protein JWM19_425, partial [Actinomycetia bacterium]|nr:hypothetical protein [Actinomycetes bacterium]